MCIGSNPQSTWFGNTATLFEGTDRAVETRVFQPLVFPIWIRVFAEDRGTTGPYELAGHKLACDSADTSCPFAAHQPREELLPQAPVNVDDTTWYEARPQQLANGNDQRAVFTIESSDIDASEVTVFEKNQSTLVDVVSTPTAAMKNAG